MAYSDKTKLYLTNEESWAFLWSSPVSIVLNFHPPGTVERALYGEDKQTNFEQGSGAEGTIILDDYLHFHKVIRLLDTRGFWDVNDAVSRESLNIMTGRSEKIEDLTSQPIRDNIFVVGF